MDSLILLHGALGSAAQMAPLARELESEFNVLVVELPGHGKTSSVAPFSIPAFAEHVLRFIDGRGVKRAHFFGYSMGGYVALYIAAHTPERVISVTTLGTKFGWTPEIAAKECKRLDAGVIRGKVPAFAASLEKRHREAGGWERMIGRTAELVRGLGDEPVLNEATLRRINAPVLVMVGDGDTTVSADETELASSQITDAGFRVLPATPHPIEQVSFHTIASELRSFVAGQPTTTGDGDQ